MTIATITVGAILLGAALGFLTAKLFKGKTQEREISFLKEKHTKEVTSLKDGHKFLAEELKKGYKEDIIDLKEKHLAEIVALKAESDECKKLASDLETEHLCLF